MFTTPIYLPVLFFCALLFWAIPKTIWRTFLLVLCSLLFIWHFDHFSAYIVFVLSVFTYIMGFAIWSSKHKKFFHIVGIIGLILILAICKYLGFLQGILNGIISFNGSFPDPKIEKILAPLGMSYIVFKCISYLTDIYWRIVKPGTFIDFLCYCSLFTIYIAGPIERFERLQKELIPFRLFDWHFAETAIKRIVIGFFKKLVLADTIYSFATPLWKDFAAQPLIFQLVGLIAYAFNIYLDFAGYSDIAIGSSRLFGIQIMENFDNPYLAVNISQFWRKWHISLSDWIRDYLYFPLSRFSSNRLWSMITVPIIAMALCGLWHGAAWHFILWGVWHGFGLAILQIFYYCKREYKSLAKLTQANWFQYCAWLLTFGFVLFGWVLFANFGLFNPGQSQISPKSPNYSYFPKKGFLLLFLSALIIFANPLYNRIASNCTAKLRTFFDLVVFLFLVEIIMNLSAGSSTFIYAGF